MLIAITGGIGSGKSVVSNILRCLGYEVYDSDSRAKTLMDRSERIKAAIASEIAAEALDAEGELDRKVLAQAVFADKVLLEKLNSIVHGAVIDDLLEWYKDRAKTCFIETAILYQSGLDRFVDEVWEVYAPEQLRIQRVCRRNGLSPQEVEQRIASQRFDVESPHPYTYKVLNDDCNSLILQVDSLLAQTTERTDT